VRQGFGELIFTGLPTAVSPGGSLIEGGVIGVGQATYTTLPGDTAFDVFSQLLRNFLDAQGVDVFQSATALSIFSDEPDAAITDRRNNVR